MSPNECRVCGWSDPHQSWCRAVVALPGVGKDAPVTTNERGGRQSSTPYFFRGLPPLALAAIARLMKEKAAVYDADTPGGPFADPTTRNWHKIESWEHLERVWHHLVAETAGDAQDDHLTHLACRALMALEMRERKKLADKT